MITLRPATIADSPAIATLHAESWRHTYRGIFSDAYLDNNVYEDRANLWRQRLQPASPNQFVTVAMEHDKLVGFACVFIDKDAGFGSLLDNLHVSPALQRSGIGKMLMRDCANTVLQNSTSRSMYLWVYELNRNAVQVYEKLGGKRFETMKKTHTDGTSATSFRYIWEDLAILFPSKNLSVSQ